MSKIGKKIKLIREKRGLTQMELAKKTGLHQVVIARIESGARKNPALLSRKKLARALSVSITELLD